MKKFIVLAIFGIFLTGCASIINDTEQAITVTSEPEGAEIYVDGINMGVTPTTVTLKKNKYSNIMLKKKGYKTQTLPLGKQYDSVAILNIFWDFSTTDAITGAIYQYEPNKYNFIMEKGDS